MFQNLHPEYELANIRERHARLRRQADYSRQFREAKRASRFHSRQRRP